MAVRDYIARTIIARNNATGKPTLFLIEGVYRRSLMLRRQDGHRESVALDTTKPLSAALFGWRIANWREAQAFDNAPGSLRLNL